MAHDLARWRKIQTEFRDAYALSPILHLIRHRSGCDAQFDGHVISRIGLPTNTNLDEFSRAQPVTGPRGFAPATREFAALAARAGAELPIEFNEQLSRYRASRLAHDAESQWLALLFHMSGALEPDEPFHDGTFPNTYLPLPFEESIKAIDSCGLATDHPLLPGFGNTSTKTAGISLEDVAHLPTDSDIPKACELDRSGPDRPDKPNSSDVVVHLPVSAETPEAVEMLMNWNEILDTVKRPNERLERARLLRLNEESDGPIAPAKKGGQPSASKQALVDWWNDMNERNQEFAENRCAADTERKCNVGDDAQHDFGRSSTVVPEISGEIRSRKVTKRRD